ncbi:MAG: TVP38/TMEM64 family protein [Synechococcales bacterium]|nr:TVP38/TMEM64 family protein [Synechococcales bacterium]
MAGLFEQLLTWIQQWGAIGVLVFILSYAIATVLLIPGSVLTLGAGAIFNVVWGSLYVFLGATLGSVAAFLIGRYWARSWVARRIEGNRQFVAIDHAIAQEGFKIVLLTRLSPLIPFSLLNYALALTQVSLKDYTLAATGMIPGTVMYVYIGSLAGDLAMHQEVAVLQWVIRIVGFLATVAVTLYITRLAKQALNAIVDQDSGRVGLESEEDN